MQNQDLPFPLRIALVELNGRILYAGGVDEDGDYVANIFTDEDLAERWVSHANQKTAKIQEIANTDELVTTLRELQNAKFTGIIFDTSSINKSYSGKVSIADFLEQIKGWE